MVRLEPPEVVGLSERDKVIKNSCRKRGREGKGFTGGRRWMVQML